MLKFKILEHSKELIKLAIVQNNNKLIILSKEDFIQIRKVYDILNNYQTNSNYLLVYIFSNNVKFNTHNITFNGLDNKYLNYFIENSFPCIRRAYGRKLNPAASRHYYYQL